jgi:hypothetical protein
MLDRKPSEWIREARCFLGNTERLTKVSGGRILIMCIERPGV